MHVPCPRCNERWDRLVAQSDPAFRRFKPGVLIKGKCDRCVYVSKPNLGDTAEFILPPRRTRHAPEKRVANVVSCE